MMVREKIQRKLKRLAGSDDLLIPPDPKLGDFAYPCFELAKEQKRNPADVAIELAGKIGKIKGIKQVIASGPYLNFFIDPSLLATSLLPKIHQEKEYFGKGRPKQGKVMIEFSQANTHKAFHVGHLRGTSLGESLSRILIHAGYDLVRANYQGDTGAHVAKWLWAYQKYHGDEDIPDDDQEGWIAGIYVESVKKIALQPEFQLEVDEINKRLEERGDQRLVELWKRSRKWSLDALERIYQDLDVHFDIYFFEGDVEAAAKRATEAMLKKGIAKVDNDATIVDLEPEGLGVWVLLRKDGTTLYSAKDLALAEIKFKEHHITRSVYVVGAAQSMHFKQLFMTLKKAKFPMVDRCAHLAFAEVRLPEGKMSSRTGENILYSALKTKVLETTREEVEKRHPEWTTLEKEVSAFNIAMAAIKFGMIAQDPNKNIVFDIDKAIDFEGETGPYIQYAHARICSIMRRYGKAVRKDVDFSLLKEPEEKKLLIQMMRFEEIVEDIGENLKVNTLANFAISLAQDFNEFYHKHKVIDEDQGLTQARVFLVSCVRQVLFNALYLLGLPRPERM